MEIHNYLAGEVNSKVFSNNTFKRILGLSASIDNKLADILKNIAPICYTLNVYDALELELISEFTIYNINVRLTKAEREEYKELTRTIDAIKAKFNSHSWGNITKRTALLYKAANKLAIIKELSEHFEDKYGIVFSQTKDYANLVNVELGDICVPHHSGLNAKTRIANLKKFADGRTKVKRISSARTLDEGVTLPRLEFAVIAAGSSKPEQQIQRVGRTIRLDVDGKHAKIIRLCVVDTVEEDWLRTAQRGFKIINVKSVKDI